MMTPSTSVSLEPNSLYIYTVPLLGGRFHWSFIHVDHDGIYTTHQWAAITPDVHGRAAYVEQALPPAGLASPKSPVLGYFKVSDYSPIDVTALRTVCRGVFTESFATADANREHGITCRTWVRHVVAGLPGFSLGQAQLIEDTIIVCSKVCEDRYLSDFMAQRHYEPLVKCL